MDGVESGEWMEWSRVECSGVVSGGERGEWRAERSVENGEWSMERKLEWKVVDWSVEIGEWSGEWKVNCGERSVESREWGFFVVSSANHVVRDTSNLRVCIRVRGCTQACAHLAD